MGLYDEPKSAKDVAKEQKRELRGVTRDLERDRRYLEQEEKKLEAEVRAAAKRGDEASARVLARQLVKIREQKSKTFKMQSNVTSASYSAQSMASQVTMTKAMATTTQSMATMNQQMNLQQMQAMMGSYEKESMKMEMGQEMLDEAFDNVFEGNEIEESSVMDQIYDEIGIDFATKAGAAPTKVVEPEISEAEVEARMAALLKQ